MCAVSLSAHRPTFWPEQWQLLIGHFFRESVAQPPQHSLARQNAEPITASTNASDDALAQGVG